MKDKNQNKATKSEGSADEKATLNRDFQKMSHSRMLFSGLGNLVLLVICFWIHWSLGALFLVFWLFVLPYLDLRRLRRQEALNPPVLPPKESFDDTSFFDDKRRDQANENDSSDGWKSWDDWDEWQPSESTEALLTETDVDAKSRSEKGAQSDSQVAQIDATSRDPDSELDKRD